MLKVRNTIPWFFLVALTALIMIGCDEQDSGILTPEFDTEEEFFLSLIENDAFFASDEASLNDGDALPPDYGGSSGKMSKEIFPFRFGRVIDSGSRTVEFDRLGDTLVVATLTRTLNGRFLIAAAYSDTASFPDTLIQKPFSSTATRKIQFVRIARFDEHHRNWRPLAISLVEGGTDTGEIQITELKLELPNDSTIVVKSPTDYYFYFDQLDRSIPIFRPGDLVRLDVTLTSVSSEPDMVVLRFGSGPTGVRRHRVPMTLISEAQEGNIYVRVYAITWFAHAHLGRFNAHVDAVTRGTLFDDEDLVSTNFWGVPYIVQ